MNKADVALLLHCGLILLLHLPLFLRAVLLQFASYLINGVFHMATRRRPKPHAILITGATSGIGEAFACEYAEPGVTLALTGRDRERLAAVREKCEQKGATVIAETMDVTNAEAVRAWIAAVDDRVPLDLVIANAGVVQGTLNDRSLESVEKMFQINVNGAFNTVLPAAARMRARHQGQIVIMSSVASFSPEPMSNCYAASKAALRFWGESIRPMLADDGVSLVTVCPGFVESRMTEQNKFAMPTITSSGKFAHVVRERLMADPAVVGYPVEAYGFGYALSVMSPEARESFNKVAHRFGPKL